MSSLVDTALGQGVPGLSARGAPAVHSQRLTTRTSACLQGTSQLVMLHHGVLKDSRFLSHCQQQRKGKLERGSGQGRSRTGFQTNT